jgi:hypothetical protein
MTAPTPIISGFINTGTNTPTGAAKKVAVDNPYLEKEEFIRSYVAKGLGLSANSPEYASGQLEETLLEATAVVNRYCGRWFDCQTIDETKTAFTVRPYNPQLVTVVLANRPYSRINSIYIQVLKWFIQVQTTGANSYLQDFYDLGFYKIVPMLSNAGNGLGSPIPSQIIDRVPLGVLWTNYTFGYGQPITGQELDKIDGSVSKQYQAPVTNRLWAPSQPTAIYDAGVLVAAEEYTIDYPNGVVTFESDYTVNGTVTADFVTNESVPAEIKQATALVAQWLIGQATDNPLGVQTLTVQTYSVTFGEDNQTQKRFERLLSPYAQQLPRLI